MSDKLIENIAKFFPDNPNSAAIIAAQIIADLTTDGDYLPREAVIKGVLMQMQASLNPVCMEEFLMNLQGVTLAEDDDALGKKPITNGDRIRAMTDEELAKEFEAMASYCAPGTYPNVEICRIERCVECWLNWLKQQAKEETK